MTYPEAIQFLYGLSLFGTELGLEKAFKLAALAGNPQNALRFIHVAGTNGKGSTCAMLESIYRIAGLRVGLFTSPHLVSFGERIQVNRQPVNQQEVVRLVSELQPLLDSFPADAHPTFFEAITIMALCHFADQKCDLVVWETGLGGRLDATNIVTPLASVITSLGLDHEKWLGATIQQIASEKAGIIKPGLPVITSASAGQGLERIVEVARQRQSPLTVIGWNEATQPPLDKVRLPLLGDFQKLNAALAVATVRALAKTIPVSEETIAGGLSRVSWPGRLQLIERAGGQLILLDGAHNPAGAEVLRSEIQKRFTSPKPTLILGILEDKDWKTIGAVLAPRAGRVLLTPVKSERTLAPAELLPVCQQANPQASVLVCSGLAEALEKAKEDRLVVVTGSLYLVGEAMELLGLLTAPSDGESRLNEWGRGMTNAQ